MLLLSTSSSLRQSAAAGCLRPCDTRDGGVRVDSSERARVIDSRHGLDRRLLPPAGCNLPFHSPGSHAHFRRPGSSSSPRRAGPVVMAKQVAPTLAGVKATINHCGFSIPQGSLEVRRGHGDRSPPHCGHDRSSRNNRHDDCGVRNHRNRCRDRGRRNRHLRKFPRSSYTTPC